MRRIRAGRIPGPRNNHTSGGKSHMSHRRSYAALLLIGIFLVSVVMAFSAQGTAAQAAHISGSSRAISHSVLSGVAGGTGTPTITPVIFTPTITPTATATPPCGLAWNITNSPNPGPNNNSVNGIAA